MKIILNLLKSYLKLHNQKQKTKTHPSLSSNRCSNQNCFENRDLAATLNFRHILMSQREN
ncbi:hypothetical protein BDF14DRAFT_1753699, partial [Spinellus fusiger]